VELSQRAAIHIMSKAIVKTTFEASRTLRPIYTGGSTALDASGRILLTCVGEDALIVDLETGDQLASLEGVSTIFQCSREPVLTILLGWRDYYELGEYVAFPYRS
jgi:U3 small nucleolar RNA-associated protein 13